MTYFEKILIANRGEIAVRIIRACRELGIKSVTIYSDADKYSLHVKMADEAFYIGKPDPLDSYLNIEKIINIADEAGVDAIHPGYGFLSENYRFAEACKKNKITFIGPSAEVLKKIKDKLYAKLLMRKADIPVVPGSLSPIEDLDDALAVANEIGYPVLLKPAAGGGGIGMYVAWSPSQLKKMFKQAQKQAFNVFGDDSIYIERYLTRPRHIEFQIIADKYGNVVHLGERECSIQRRHQKLIEESPSPALSEEERTIMGGYAVKAAKAINYDSVGTIEFIYQDGEFYFLEINARIQVEHGITELRTGIDLIKEQIRIAAGEKIGYTQSDITLRGWAIECRINAEDPFNNFLPNPGTIEEYFEPGGFGIRVDSGVRSGSSVPPEYDPLIAKLMVWDIDRLSAINRMRRALDEFVITGIKTTIPLYNIIFSEKNFIKGNYNTLYLDNYLRGLLNEVYDEELKRVAAVTAAINVLIGKNLSKLTANSTVQVAKKVRRYIYPQNQYEIFYLSRWGKRKNFFYRSTNVT